PPVELLDPVRLLDVSDDDLLAVRPRTGCVLGVALDADDPASSRAQDLAQVAMCTADVEDRAIMSHEPDDLGDGRVLVREVGGEVAVLRHARRDPTASRLGRRPHGARILSVARPPGRWIARRPRRGVAAPGRPRPPTRRAQVEADDSPAKRALGEP